MVSDENNYSSLGKECSFDLAVRRYSLSHGFGRPLAEESYMVSAIICGVKDKEELDQLHLDSPLIFVNSRDYKYLFQNIRIDRLIICPVKSSWDGSWKLDKSEINNLRKMTELIDMARSRNIKTILYISSNVDDISLPPDIFDKFDSTIREKESLSEFISHKI